MSASPSELSAETDFNHLASQRRFAGAAVTAFGFLAGTMGFFFAYGSWALGMTTAFYMSGGLALAGLAALYYGAGLFQNCLKQKDNLSAWDVLKPSWPKFLTPSLMAMTWGVVTMYMNDYMDELAAIAERTETVPVLTEDNYEPLSYEQLISRECANDHQTRVEGHGYRFFENGDQKLFRIQCETAQPQPN